MYITGFVPETRRGTGDLYHLCCPGEWNGVGYKIGMQRNTNPPIHHRMSPLQRDVPFRINLKWVSLSWTQNQIAIRSFQYQIHRSHTTYIFQRNPPHDDPSLNYDDMQRRRSRDTIMPFGPLDSAGNLFRLLANRSGRPRDTTIGVDSLGFRPTQPIE